LLNSFYCWPQSLLGLDIQDEEIRLLQLQGFFKKKSIKQALALSLPLGAVTEGNIQEAEVVSDCLKELVHDNQLQGFEVAIALPAQSVVSQSISVAKGLSESDLELEVTSHLSHLMPGITEGLCYDYVILNSQDAVQNEVLIVTTSFMHLNTYLTVVQNAGLKVRIVDVDQYALTRANQLVKKNNLNIEEKWLISFGLALRGVYLWQR
jgi:type IV pilus assembly protein PilM